MCNSNLTKNRTINILKIMVSNNLLKTDLDAKKQSNLSTIQFNFRLKSIPAKKYHQFKKINMKKMRTNTLTHQTGNKINKTKMKMKIFMELKTINF
jgi:hypothetical protein